ncbi:hypothetical protein ScPMuIL_009457 [Solemya velum]
MANIKIYFERTCERLLLKDIAVGTTFINPCLCNGWYECTNPYNIIARNCSAGLGWDHNTKTCKTEEVIVHNGICSYQHPWQRCNVTAARENWLAADCSGVILPTTTTEPKTTEDPIFTGLCEQLDLRTCAEGTKYNDPCSCESYYTCGADSTIDKSACPTGKFWHQTNSTCVDKTIVESNNICSAEKPWASCNTSESRLTELAANCGGIYPPASTTEVPATDSPIFPGLCEQLDLRTCADGTKYIDPCSCDSVYICGSGSTIDKSTCPEGLWWYQANKTCVNKAIVESENICSREKPWNQCDISAGALSSVAKKCGYVGPSVTPAPPNNTGAIVGAVVAVLLVLIIAAAALIFWKKRKAKKSKSSETVLNPEYFEDRGSIYNTIHEDMSDPTYNADSTMPRQWSRQGGSQFSNGPPNDAAPPVPSMHGREQETVEYDNPGAKNSQLGLKLASDNNTSDQDSGLDVENGSPDRYLQLSDTYKLAQNPPETEHPSTGEYLEPISNTLRPNSATREEHF